MPDTAAAPVPSASNFAARIAAPATTNAPIVQPGAPPVPTVPTQQAPANDNATPPPEQPQVLQQVQQQQSAETAQQQPAEWWQQKLQGDLDPKDVIEALRTGRMHPALADHIKDTFNINGNEIEVPYSETKRSYYRLGDYSRDKNALAQERANVEAVKAKLLEAFGGWDKPEVFEQRVTNMGMLGNVRSMMAKNWMADGKPNPERFIDDMRRMPGGYDAFRAAVQHYANQRAQRIRQFNPFADHYKQQIAATQDPNARAALQQELQQLNAQALQQWEAYEKDQQSIWETKLKAESELERVQRENAARQQQQLLAQQQVQQPQIDMGALMQRVSADRDQALTAAGLNLQAMPLAARAAAQQYFNQNFVYLLNMANADGATRPIPDMIQEAVQHTLIALKTDGTGTNNGAAAQPQMGLPARPAATPTTQANTPGARTASAFEDRLRAQRR